MKDEKTEILVIVKIHYKVIKQILYVKNESYKVSMIRLFNCRL